MVRKKEIYIHTRTLAHTHTLIYNILKEYGNIFATINFEFDYVKCYTMYDVTVRTQRTLAE